MSRMAGTFGKRPTMLPGGYERRRSAREKVSLGGTIVLGPGKTVRCSILDRSETGAQILVQSVLGVPLAFDLHDDAGSRRRVRVARWGVRCLGVLYL